MSLQTQFADPNNDIHQVLCKTKPRLLDLFCGRWGWSRAFAARGWECVGVDLVEPPEIPDGFKFCQLDVLTLSKYDVCHHLEPDFICASSPCEQFSVHGMKHFHPNPKYPELGIKLFNHTRELCEASGVPYVMENVRAAQQFVGNAVHHCGPFYLWGSGVPALMNQGISKGISTGNSELMKSMTREEKREYRKNFPWASSSSGSALRKSQTAAAATIPPELANCVADYAERLLEQRAVTK
jgi:hypothetical protein